MHLIFMSKKKKTYIYAKSKLEKEVYAKGEPKERVREKMQKVD